MKSLLHRILSILLTVHRQFTNHVLGDQIDTERLFKTVNVSSILKLTLRYMLQDVYI